MIDQTAENFELLEQRLQDIASIRKSELKRIPSEVIEWVGIESCGACLDRAILKESKRIANLEFGAALLKAIPIQGAEAVDYTNRIVQTGNQRNVAIAGIRFQGLDPSLPFIDLPFRDFRIEKQDFLSSLSISLKLEFSIFQPFAFRLYVDEAELAWLNQNLSEFESGIDFFIIGGRINDMISTSHTQQGNVSIVQVLDNFDYNLYVKEYEMFLKQHRSLIGIISPETQAALVKCRDSGMLFEILIDDVSAGIFAIDKMEHRFLCGYHVVEELLYHPFRGRGFGPIIQKKVAELLPKSDHDLFFGEISPFNQPSLITGQRAGRKILTTAIFVNL